MICSQNLLLAKSFLSRDIFNHKICALELFSFRFFDTFDEFDDFDDFDDIDFALEARNISIFSNLPSYIHIPLSQFSLRPC